MMLHRDASTHAWAAGEIWDLAVTMADATSDVYSGFFVAEDGTMSSFRALGEVIAENGLDKDAIETIVTAVGPEILVGCGNPGIFDPCAA